MPSRQVARNSLTIAVSLLVLLVAFVGNALADRRESPRRPERPVGAIHHDTKFHAVPGAALQIRATTYNGSTNGALTVQIKNQGKTAQKFSAAGLYFIPEGNPDSAPQRLGAVGPMQIGSENDKEVTEVTIAAGATVEVKLDVFCIDSHRSSPSPQNVFNVGASRMPKELVQKIEGNADRAVRAKRASGEQRPRPAAKGDIQGEVWKSRDAKWIKLEGEGQQEAHK
jgi:hypothetical protein